MLELGQPLHAFDADKLKGGINVRLARDGEKFLALDGKTYSLTSRKPASSPMTPARRDRRCDGRGRHRRDRIDAAMSCSKAPIFCPASVRRTARELNLPSDASYRFERGVDPGMVLRASERADAIDPRNRRRRTGRRNRHQPGRLPAAPADVSLALSRAAIELSASTVAPRERGSNSGRLRSDENRRDRGAIDLAHPELSFRSAARSRSDRGDRARLSESIAFRARSQPVHSRSSSGSALRFRMQLRQRLVARGFSEARTSALIGRATLGTGFRRERGRAAQSAERRSCRAAAEPFPACLACLGAQYPRRREERSAFRTGPRLSSARTDGKIGISHCFFCGKAAARDALARRRRAALDFFDLKGAIESVWDAALSFRRARATGVCARD